MITEKNLSLNSIYAFAGHHLIWLTAWMSIATVFIHFNEGRWMMIPWPLLAIVGTSVAFYLGFKNNQAYDRLWEARKIWGAILNNSRILATMIKHFLNNEDEGYSAQLKRTIIKRNILYAYTLREQLLKPSEWEHVAQRGRIGIFNRKRKSYVFDSVYGHELKEIKNRVFAVENDYLRSVSNKAVHLLDKQTEEIAMLFKKGSFNQMQHIELQRTINDFYQEQGKAERIKRFPFPKQFGSFCYVFVCIFVFLLPFGIAGEFSKLGSHAIWMTIPLGVIVGWIYVVMELIGDYSENPFGGLAIDIPMLSICSTIETDLLQMLGEDGGDISIKSKSGVLI